MKICIDTNHLLVIENENIPKVKEYTYNVDGYFFSDFDKGIIVLHKKNWKIVNLKHLSDNLSVVYVKKNPQHLQLPLQLNAFESALKIFQGFNEHTGEKYFFLPTISEKTLVEKNNILQKLGSSCILKKSEKGIICEFKDSDSSQFVWEDLQGCESILSFLFGLVIIYGKFEGKKNELASCKIQLPLFGQYLQKQEKLDEILAGLANQGIFLKVDKIQTSNGIVYQMSCTDYEVLELFAHWYQPVEKFEKITKRDFTEEMKIKLLDFIKTDKQIPQEGRQEVIEYIEKGILKLLTK